LAKYFLVAHERLQEMTELESALYYPNTVAAIYLIYVSSKLFRDRHIEQKNILKVGNEQKERLITVLTHDLRSPFNSLKGLLSMVSSNDIDQKKFQEFIPKIAKEVEQSSLMIDNLLYWIKGQMNGVKPEYNFINIQQIIDENKVFLDSNLKEKNILFVVKNELALTECNVLVDKEMMSAVIRNLLTNAIKFCKPNAGRIEVVISKELNNKISLKIADNGRGMNEKQLSGLFENNHTSNVGTTNEKGFGLGLLLVKSFADEMNIEIKVESQLNQGTAFYMQIPT